MTFPAPAAAPGGPVAETINQLWLLMLLLGIAMFALFAALLIGGARRRSDAGADARTLTRRWIIGGGVLLPTAVLLGVFGATVRSMRQMPSGPEPGDLVVDIVAHQWRYEVRYPDGGVTAGELHLPVGRRILLRLSSVDVIHSFWVPELAGKMDMLPDKVNTLVLQADVPARYTARCAEFCGLHHTTMTMPVIAEPGEQFTAWLAAQR